MTHYKEFLIKLQTLNIQVTPRKLVREGNQQKFSLYTISHQNPYSSDMFKNELKELKEFALIDILNLPPEQIQLVDQPHLKA